jgi:hypothetical protein
MQNNCLLNYHNQQQARGAARASHAKENPSQQENPFLRKSSQVRKHGAIIEVPPFLQQISSTPQTYQSSRNGGGQTLGTFLASAQS